jgi:hypothetical protein
VLEGKRLWDGEERHPATVCSVVAARKRKLTAAGLAAWSPPRCHIAPWVRDVNAKGGGG